MVTSNSGSAASSSRAVASRRSRSSAASRSPARPAGGPARPTTAARGRRTGRRASLARTCRAPCRSISSSAGRPAARLRRPARAGCRSGAAGGRRPTPAAHRGDHPVELVLVDEVVVHAVDLAGPRGPGRRRHRDPDLGVAGAQSRGDGALADGGGSGEHGQPAGSSPVRRRLPARGASAAEALDERGDLVGPEPAHPAGLGDADLVHDLRARTLPTPGRDSSRADTFILPITSSSCPSLITSGGCRRRT